MYSRNSFPSAFPPSCPLALVHTDMLLKLSLKVAQGVIHIIYITTEPGDTRQGWGSVVPAAIRPLSTKIVSPKEVSVLNFYLEFSQVDRGRWLFADASDSPCKLLWMTVLRKTSFSVAEVSSNKTAKWRYLKFICWWCRTHSSQPVAGNTDCVELKRTLRFCKFIVRPVWCLYSGHVCISTSKEKKTIPPSLSEPTRFFKAFYWKKPFKPC